MQLRNWLKQTPHPHKIRAWDADGEQKTVRVNDAKSRWRDAELSLQGSVKCEAVDPDGEILRTWVDPDFDDAPKGVVGPVKSELAELARIITESNDQAVGRLTEIIAAALGANAALVATLSERNRQLEHAWQTLLQKQPEQEPTSQSEALLATVVAGAMPALLQSMQGQPQKKPPPNGAKQ